MTPERTSVPETVATYQSSSPTTVAAGRFKARSTGSGRRVTIGGVPSKATQARQRASLPDPVTAPGDAGSSVKVGSMDEAGRPGCWMPLSITQKPSADGPTTASKTQPGMSGM